MRREGFNFEIFGAPELMLYLDMIIALAGFVMPAEVGIQQGGGSEPGSPPSRGRQRRARRQ